MHEYQSYIINTFLCLFNLDNKLEDKDKIIKCLKDEIDEISKPKDCLEDTKIDSVLKIKKLNQDILDFEINNNELKQQITELENKFKVLSEKVIQFYHD